MVLSGTGSDGAVGIRAIKGEGDVVMVQSPESTEFDGMPRSAISTAIVDYVLPPEEMAEALISYTTQTLRGTSAESGLSDHTPDTEKTGTDGMDESDGKILGLLRQHNGHDFSYYKSSTVRRRIERRMALLEIDEIEAYVAYAQRKSEELDALFRDLLIGVVHFFGNAESFAAFEKLIVPKLFVGKRSGDPVRVWTAGCSTGEEAYSIAISLHEYMETLPENYNLQVFASDMAAQAIAVARSGIYPASTAADVRHDRLSRYFTEESFTPEGIPESYRINREIRDVMIFSEQNVIKDPPFSNIDLLSCRNLLIYLNSDLHEKLIPLFHYALRPAGFLFLGTSESIGDYTDLFDTLDRKAKLYQRKESARAGHRGSRPLQYSHDGPKRAGSRTDTFPAQSGTGGYDRPAIGSTR
ncbi:MAG: CheR family methyltransferase [Spirochaetota bacterium]